MSLRVVGFLFALTAACVPDAPLGKVSACAPSATEACVCPNGGAGQRVCLDDGSRFGTCGGCVAEGGDGGIVVSTGRDGGVGSKPVPRDAGVQPMPGLAVSPVMLAFEADEDGTRTEPQILRVQNVGDVALSVQLGLPDAFVSVTPSSLTLAAGADGEVEVRADPAGMRYGLHRGAVQLAAEGVPNAEVAIRFVVREDWDPAPPAGPKLSVVGFTLDESDPDAPHLLVTFARRVDESTLDSNSFVLRQGGQTIAGSLRYNDSSRQARFAPDAPLQSGVKYELTITTSVRSTTGASLDQNDYQTGAQPFVREFDLEMPVVRLESFIAMVGIGDVWIDQGFVYVAGRSSGPSIWVVDATDLPNAAVAARIENRGFTQDVKAEEGVLYGSNEPGGVRIFDVSDPYNPVYIRRIFDDNTQSVHNVSTSGGYLLASSNNTGRIEIYDVFNPSTPRPIGSLSNPNDGSQIHDQTVENGILYGAFLDGGLTIADFSNPASPQVFVDLSYPDDFCHNAWPSTDGRFLFTSDELLGGPMRVWDITNVRAPRQVATYTPHASSVIHNILVLDQLALISFYTQGLRIVDISDAPNPREVQFYDTFPGRDASALMDGAWGVHAEGDILAISDMDTGLYLFRFEP